MRYVYAREWEGEKILVICSFSDQPQKFTAPKAFDLKSGSLVLNNYPAPADGLLRPYEVRVYLWK